MTRKEMERVLGGAAGEAFIDMLVGFKVADVDVRHVRPILEGPMTRKKGDRLIPVYEDDGAPREFTGAQMAAHLRHYVAAAPSAGRYYFAQRGGKTIVTLRVGDRGYIGEAVCSEKDLFVKEEGRRIALVRAILSIGGNAAEQLGLLAFSPRREPHGTAEALPKPRFATLGVDPVGNPLDFSRMFLHTPLPRGSLHFGLSAMSPFLEFMRPAPLHVRLERRAVRKLEEAAGLDVEADETKGKKKRKRLREEARVLREQALADSGVAAQIKPDPQDEGIGHHRHAALGILRNEA